LNDTPRTYSFAWLNVAQFLGALNDNIFKFLIIFLVVELTGAGHYDAIVTTVSTVFVIPFLLFSHAGGVLADRFSKRHIIVCLKILEILIMLSGCAAVYFGSPRGLYAVLFVLCTHSALFGPSKYGIVPELVPTEKLSHANASLQGLTYLAIILGTFIPSFFLDMTKGNYLALAAISVGVAVAGLFSASRIHVTPAARAVRRFSPLFVLDIFRTLRRVKGDRDLLSAMIGSAYFMFLAAFVQQDTFLYGGEFLQLDWIKCGYLFPVAALGIGAGALLSGRLSGRNIEFGIVPIGAFGLTFTCLALSIAEPTLRSVLGLIFLMGFFSGMFIVPLDAFIQFRSPANQRGEILACTNFLSFFGVALSAGALALLKVGLGLDAGQCFVVIGLLTGAMAAVSLVVLPDFFVRFIILIVTRCLYRIRIIDRENVPTDGAALLVSNHVTWADALLISATQQRRVRFIMARDIYEHWVAKPLFKIMRVIPISPTDPPRQVIASLQEARAALDDGYLVCIFAEGAITRNGTMRGFRAGLERILKGSAHPIIPVYIGGAWGSIFSYYHGKLLSTFPRKIPYPVTLLFGPSLPASSTTPEVEQKVTELSGRWFDLQKSRRRTLPMRFVHSARRFWFRTAMTDTTGKHLSFGQVLTAAIALADRIHRLAGDRERIGLLLPSSTGGALANMAVTLLGRVPVNLNFTASADAMESAIQQSEITTVISSRAFLTKMDGLKVPEGTVYLEDLVAGITAPARCAAFLKAMFASARSLQQYRRVSPDDVATIIFSSGSTAEPKGVMLSHHNILSNIESFRMMLRIEPQDRMCCILPFFHSFGYTCCLWCPALSGFEAAFHTNPIDGGTVADMVRERKLTILLATPTFLLAYIRRAKREDFASLRAIITGAEKLRKKTADVFEERFGIRPMEGYGATELSPVAAFGIPDIVIDGVRQKGTKEGSVGHAVPGVTIKVIDADTGLSVEPGKEGLLLIKGPNVMLGYLDNPKKTAEAVKDGWYVTGDVGVVDRDGFVFLLDRLSRYSKIGGEMVPHLAVEDQYLHALGAMNQSVAVTSAPDEKKGEQLVVFYTDEAGTPDRLHDIIAHSSLPNLWKPKKDSYIHVDSLPTLGSGKMDLKRLKSMAEEFAYNRTQNDSKPEESTHG